MRIALSCFVLVLLSWTSSILFGQITTPDQNAERLLYVAEPQPPMAHRYREIETGLPDGLTREQLLADVDPKLNSKWKLGWFAYGEGNSRSVAVGLRGDSHAELFVDVDRDKRFTAAERVERVPGDRHPWQVAIGAEFLTGNNQSEHLERSILIRQSRGQGLEIATQGVMRGSVLVDGTPMPVVRVDRDANGRWFDPSDRIILDMNGDGKADPIGERISCESVCRMNGKRFVLKSDMRGERLKFVELSGLGSIVPQIKLQSDSARIGQIAGTMVSRGGVRVVIRNLDQAIECPVGDYRVESLVFEASDGELNYWFQFSRLGVAKHPIKVTTGRSVTAFLLGELTLSSIFSSGSKGTAKTLTITPLLEASGGLCLTGCKVGRGRPTMENRLLTQSLSGDQIIDNGSTGFS